MQSTMKILFSLGTNKKQWAKRSPSKLTSMSQKDQPTGPNQHFDKQLITIQPANPDSDSTKGQIVEFDWTRRLTRGERNKVEMTQSKDRTKTEFGYRLQDPENCWGQGHQCGSMNNICDGEEPAYESKQDTHREGERERDRHKEAIYSKRQQLQMTTNHN